MANESRSDVVALYSAGLRWPILPGRSRLQRLSAGIHAAKGAARLEHDNRGMFRPEKAHRVIAWPDRAFGRVEMLVIMRGYCLEGDEGSARRRHAETGPTRRCFGGRPCRSCKNTWTRNGSLTKPGVGIPLPCCGLN